VDYERVKPIAIESFAAANMTVMNTVFVVPKSEYSRIYFYFQIEGFENFVEVNLSVV
jgi:hypothetical protein